MIGNAYEGFGSLGFDQSAPKPTPSSELVDERARVCETLRSRYQGLPDGVIEAAADRVVCEQWVENSGIGELTVQRAMSSV